MIYAHGTIKFHPKNLIKDKKKAAKRKIALFTQSRWLGFKLRTKIKQLQDGMTYDILIGLIDNFNSYVKFNNNMNQKLKNKKIRRPNFPSEISENIAKFAICKFYGFMPNWDSKPGDLIIKCPSGIIIIIEVKGSIDFVGGPPTFGPTEKWDKIYFVDGKDGMDKIYKVYEINLSNKCDTWKNIKINKTETYYDQCLQKRRPRIAFNKLKSQLGDHCKLIFDGHISELNNTL